MHWHKRIGTLHFLAWLALSCTLVLAHVVAGAPRGTHFPDGTTRGEKGEKEKTGESPELDLDGFPLWGWLIIAFGSVSLVASVALSCLWCCCRRKNGANSMDSVLAGQTQPTPPCSLYICPLCEKNVSLDSWQSGKHRKKCAQKHKKVLNAMETPTGTLRCPKCRHRLRQWPARRGPPFVCDSSQCAIIGRVQSNGNNRFNCFLCNYDLCDSCARRKYRESSTTRHVRSSSTKSARSNSNRSNRNSQILTVTEEKEKEGCSRERTPRKSVTPSIALAASSTQQPESSSTSRLCPETAAARTPRASICSQSGAS